MHIIYKETHSYHLKQICTQDFSSEKYHSFSYPILVITYICSTGRSPIYVDNTVSEVRECVAFYLKKQLCHCSICISCKKELLNIQFVDKLLISYCSFPNLLWSISYGGPNKIFCVTISAPFFWIKIVLTILLSMYEYTSCCYLRSSHDFIQGRDFKCMWYFPMPEHYYRFQAYLSKISVVRGTHSVTYLQLQAKIQNVTNLGFHHIIMYT